MFERILRTLAAEYPAILPHLNENASLKYCEVKQTDRDPAEPGRKEKTDTEKELAKVMQTRFARQLAEVQRQLEKRYPQKAINVDGIIIDDSDEEYAEFVRIFYAALLGGTTLSEELIGISLADGSVNARALNIARTYVTEWLQGLDSVSRDAIRRGLETFIQPGGTIGDMVSILEPQFGAMRAQRIAVTETTRIYALANDIYAEELRLQFPGTKIERMWFTNNDDRVCSICAPLDGKTVKPGEYFDPIRKIQKPPAHVNCRCWDSVTVKA